MMVLWVAGAPGKAPRSRARSRARLPDLSTLHSSSVPLSASSSRCTCSSGRRGAVKPGSIAKGGAVGECKARRVPLHAPG